MVGTLYSCSVYGQDLVRSNSNFQHIVDVWQGIDAQCFNSQPVIYKNVPLYKSVDEMQYSTEASYLDSPENIDLHAYYSGGELIRIDVFTTAASTDIQSTWYYAAEKLIYVKKDFRMYTESRKSTAFDKYDYEDFKLEYFFEQEYMIGWYLEPEPERDLQEKVVRILEKDMKHDAEVFAAWPSNKN